MLDVEGSVNVDAGFEQLGHILITLGVTGAGGVGMGQLIDKRQAGMMLENGVDIHFGQFDVPVGNGGARDDFQPEHERFSLGALVGFHVADYNVHAFVPALVSGFEHGVGLAHPGGVAQEDFQLAAAILLLGGFQLGEEDIGVGAGRKLGHGDNILRICGWRMENGE